ncbi:MAG: SPOR domain-containing protein [Gemmobacter sp.]
MADASFDDFVTHTPATHAYRSRAGRVGRVVNLTGAVVSVALVVGVAVWGYRLAVRDVTGVPVIQAMSDPMRIAPEDPGGRIAAHLGLSVNTVAAEGTAAPLPEQLILAPRPLDLADEDAPGLTARALAEADGPEIMPGTGETGTARAADPAAEHALALAEELVAGIVSGNGPTASAADAGNGLARSPRPQPRPRVAGLSAVQATSSAPAPVTEIDPATLTAGTRLVQLGAFDDAAAARTEWDRIAAASGGIMADKARVIQPATSGGRDFFRLRAHGFASEDEARRFCAAIEGSGPRCVPVTQR